MHAVDSAATSEGAPRWLCNVTLNEIRNSGILVRVQHRGVRRIYKEPRSGCYGKVGCSYPLLLGPAPSVWVRVVWAATQIADPSAGTRSAAGHCIVRRPLFPRLKKMSRMKAAMLALHQAGADCGDSAYGISMFSDASFSRSALGTPSRFFAAPHDIPFARPFGRAYFRASEFFPTHWPSISSRPSRPRFRVGAASSPA